MVRIEDLAKERLEEEAARIYRLIQSQREHLCFAQCPAFEEIVDTQMYGLSKQVAFAISLDLLSEEDGHRLMHDLDATLNDVYTEIFEAQMQREGGSRG